MAEESNPQPGASDREELKGLSQANLELLSLAEELLGEFHPQAGTLSDLPQITVEPADTLQVCRIAKDHPRLGLKQLECLACVDYQDTFQLVYFLHSLEPDHTLAIKTNVPYDSPVLPSVTSVWQAADWYEREAHDLFGVVFNGHPSLAPLLLYEGFEGYPGRKEFPFHDYQEF